MYNIESIEYYIYRVKYLCICRYISKDCNASKRKQNVQEMCNKTLDAIE